MIKVETLGMLNISKNNPVITSIKDVVNNDFITHDDDLYLVSNTITGDDAYKEDVVIKAGKDINGYLVEAYKSMNLVADEKHIAYASGKSYADLVSGTTLLSVNTDGKLEVTATAPADGVYFKVVDKVTLTENAVKIKVLVA